MTWHDEKQYRQVTSGRIGTHAHSSVYFGKAGSEKQEINRPQYTIHKAKLELDWIGLDKSESLNLMKCLGIE